MVKTEQDVSQNLNILKDAEIISFDQTFKELYKYPFNAVT